MIIPIFYKIQEAEKYKGVGKIESMTQKHEGKW